MGFRVRMKPRRKPRLHPQGDFGTGDGGIIHPARPPAAYKPIRNDRLSTRGYQALIKGTLALVPVSVSVVYVFTDWRMWVNLFDVVESSGYGVRNMIVWNKEFPGMGVGWRSQHELIMCGTRENGMWSKYMGAQGNVHHAEA